MDLTTIKGIIRARWWVLVAAAIIAVVLSGNLAEYRNEHLPDFEAVSTVTFIEDPQTLERDDFETFLETQFALAQDVNSDVLDETPGSFIPWLLAEVDLESDQNQIQFIGRGFTQQEASELSEFMRERFLGASTIGAGQERMSQELDALTAQIGDLRRQIAQAQASTPLTPEELAVQTERTALENAVLALEAHYGTLQVELMNPVLRTAEAIRSEMDRTLAELQTQRAELSNYPSPPPDPTTSPAIDDEQTLLDQLRLQNLENRWQQLYIGQRELDALTTVGEVDEQPVTLAAASPRTNQALSLMGALVVAMAGLIAIDRGRGVMWSQNDLDEEGPAVMVEMPPRDLKVFTRPSNAPWYIATMRGRRKAAIQMLRSQLDDQRNSAIAFQGTGVLRGDIQELASDVAVAMAVSGRSVLLIDTSFHPTNRLVEFESDNGPSLVGLVSSDSVEREDLMSEYKEIFASLPEVVARLRSLRSGSSELEAADALAGYRFELLLNVAREMFDVVIVSGADLGEAASHVLAQRVDSVVLVTSAGHSNTRAIESADRDFATSRARLRGLALLRRRRNRLTRLMGVKARNLLWHGVDKLNEKRSELKEKMKEKRSEMKEKRSDADAESAQSDD